MICDDLFPTTYKWAIIDNSKLFLISHNVLFSTSSREVVLGEHDVRKDPDCENCPRKITRKIGKNNCLVHEGFINSPEVTGETYRNDIALIRLDEPVLLHSDDPKSSGLIPVCLPWSEDQPSRNLEDGNRVS